MNQNYMTNRLIKETVDKNQKNYQAPEESLGDEENIEPTTADITVKVVDSLNENVEGASVKITKDSDNYSCTTGKAGGCTIKNVPLGVYNVLTKAESYEDKEQQFTVQEGTNNLSITLTEEIQFGPGISTPTMEEEDGEF